MPGLAGIYDPRAGAAHIESALQQMQQVLAIPNLDYAFQRMTGAGVGCLNVVRRGAAPTVARDAQHGIWLMLDGEIYSSAGPIDEGAAPQEATERDAVRACLAAYLDEGEEFVRRLNGQFNLIVYREIERTLLIATDRYGYRPLFLAQVGSRLLFATEMKAIIAAVDATPRVDEIGMFWLASSGFLFG